jgi:O-antigen ligase
VSTGALAYEAPSTGGVRRALALLVVATLPFALGLTIDLRFPLKIYEVALGLAALTCLADLRIPSIPAARRAALPLVGLLGFALAVLLIHAWAPPRGLEWTEFETRFGPLGDGITKILYIILALFGFFLVAWQSYRDEDAVVRAWLLGACMAAAYAWYLILSSLTGLEPFLLPGITEPQRITFGDLVLMRAGPFAEGNYFGLYLVLSTAVALYAGRRGLALILSATALTTFSTVNVLGLVILWTLVLVRPAHRNVRISRKVLYGVVALLVIAAVGAALVATGYLQNVVLGKLSGQDVGSRLERLNQALTGLQMFWAHPIAGVGLSQYGYYYDRYQFVSVALPIDPVLAKHIANNVYIELLAELGVVGLLLFVAFLIQIWRQTKAARLRPLRYGLVSLLLALNAFPTVSVMFLWAFFGFIVGVSSRHAGAVE